MSTEAALMSCCYPDWPHQEASYSLQPSAEATPCHARVVLMLMLHRDDKSPSLAVLVAGSSTADFPVSWPCWSRLSWDVTMSFCLGQLLLSISFPFFLVFNMHADTCWLKESYHDQLIIGLALARVRPWSPRMAWLYLSWKCSYNQWLCSCYVFKDNLILFVWFGVSGFLWDCSFLCFGVMFCYFFGFTLCSFLSFDILLKLYAVYTECTLKAPFESYDCVFYK